jgi:hypothetical protein
LEGEAVVFEDSFEVFEEDIAVVFKELFEEGAVVVFKELFEEVFEDIFDEDFAVVFEDVCNVVLELNPGVDLVIDFDVVEEPVFAVDFMGVLAAEYALVDVALVIEVVLVVGCGTKS